MIRELVIEYESPGRPHLLRLEIDFLLGRAAPRCQNPSAAAFADPGEPGMAAILRAWLCRRPRVTGGTHRERALRAGIVERLRENADLEQDIWEQLVKEIDND